MRERERAVEDKQRDRYEYIHMHIEMLAYRHTLLKNKTECWIQSHNYIQTIDISRKKI